jgi:hypothetical protein
MKSFLYDFGYRFLNQFKGGIKGKICFIHTHKCGGTSIDAAIRLHYKDIDMRKDRYLVTIDSEASTNAISYYNQEPNTIYKFREQLLLYYMNIKNVKYISGHFYFCERAYLDFQDEYAFVIVLRNPVDRWISHYLFNRYKEDSFGKINSSLQECLQSEFGKHNGSEYVQYIGGISESGDYFSDDAIKRAKNNLNKFDIVGCLEYKNDFIEQFFRRFGVKLNLDRRNPNPKSNSFRESVITEETKQKILELCKPDLEVYQYAIENFVKINK